MYTKEIGTLPGFKVYKSIANFILIKFAKNDLGAVSIFFAQPLSRSFSL